MSLWMMFFGNIDKHKRIKAENPYLDDKWHPSNHQWKLPNEWPKLLNNQDNNGAQLKTDQVYPIIKQWYERFTTDREMRLNIIKYWRQHKDNYGSPNKPREFMTVYENMIKNIEAAMQEALTYINKVDQVQ